MLALSIYLGLFSTEAGPTAPVEAAVSYEGTDRAQDCVIIGSDGRVTVTPGDCVTTAAH